MLLLGAAVTGGVLAVVQGGEARDAETAQFAQRLGAQALVEEDLDRSLLLARQAVAIDDSPQTRSYLLADLLRAPAVAGVMHGDDDVLRAIAVSPDGETVAVGDYAAGTLFFDASSHERIGEPVPTDGSNWVEAMAYSADGERLALAGTGFIRLTATDTREQIIDRPIHGNVTRIAFTTDGTRIVAVIHRYCRVGVPGSASATPARCGRSARSSAPRRSDARRGEPVLHDAVLRAHARRTLAHHPRPMGNSRGGTSRAVRGPGRSGSRRVITRSPSAPTVAPWRSESIAASSS